MSRIEVETLGRRKPEFPFAYDLRFDESTHGYFTDVAAFSGKVLEHIEEHAGRILDRYLFYSEVVLQEPRMGRGEAAIDLLTVGAVMTLYGPLVSRVPGWVLKELQKLRWKQDRPASTIDMLRDALLGTFMKVPLGRRTDGRGPGPRPRMEIEQFPQLAEWLQCTIDLSEFSRCVINSLSLLRTLPSGEASDWIATVEDLFEWFQVSAAEELKGYTQGVSRFLAARRAGENRRADRFLRAKPEAAYHLAMVAAEVGNREMRRAFARCPRKLVLLPACMRGAGAPNCPGSQSCGFDVRCCDCSSDCNVSRTKMLLGLSEAEVYVENCPCNSARLASRWSREQRTGIVIVACLPIMRSIKVQTRVAGMTCQFLPLDFPGCQSHWLKRRISTTINEGELVRLVTGESLSLPATVGLGARSPRP